MRRRRVSAALAIDSGFSEGLGSPSAAKRTPVSFRLAPKTTRHVGVIALDDLHHLPDRGGVAPGWVREIHHRPRAGGEAREHPVNDHAPARGHVRVAAPVRETEKVRPAASVDVLARVRRVSAVSSPEPAGVVQLQLPIVELERQRAPARADRGDTNGSSARTPRRPDQEARRACRSSRPPIPSATSPSARFGARCRRPRHASRRPRVRSCGPRHRRRGLRTRRWSGTAWKPPAGWRCPMTDAISSTNPS